MSGWVFIMSHSFGVNFPGLRRILSGIPIDIASTVFDLPSGWNWIGYTPQLSNNINNALLNIPSGNASYIKSQAGYADYYEEFGWYGTLFDMNNTSTYKLSMNADDEILYSGVPVDASTPIELSGGWNWTGYLPQSALELNYALISLSNGIHIKSQTQYADFYPQ